MLLEDIKKYCISKHKAYETVLHSFSKKVQNQIMEIV